MSFTNPPKFKLGNLLLLNAGERWIHTKHVTYKEVYYPEPSLIKLMISWCYARCVLKTASGSIQVYRQRVGRTCFQPKKITKTFAMTCLWDSYHSTIQTHCRSKLSGRRVFTRTSYVPPMYLSCS